MCFIRYDLGNHSTRFEISLEMCHVLTKLKVNGRSISCSIAVKLPFASCSALVAEPQPYEESTMQDQIDYATLHIFFFAVGSCSFVFSPVDS